MLTWTKPNGTEIKTNDKAETIKAAEKLGWVKTVLTEKTTKTRSKKSE